MRLLTHNMLMCNVRGCSTNNFPLKIQLKADSAAPTKTEETEFNRDFVKHMLPKLDWKALVAACADLQISVPAELPENAAGDDAFLQQLHKILVDFHVEEGSLVCNNCGRAYPVVNGTPNMLLTEDEV